MLTRKTIETFFGEEWVDFMVPFVQSPEFDNILQQLKAASTAGDIIYPEQRNIFRAFKDLPLSQVRVVIVGMDPYPSEGYANGLAFSHLKNMKKAASMEKIIDAIERDCYDGLKFDKESFDTELGQWISQGVMLLNSSLTVKKDTPGSHSIIWQPFIEFFFKTMNQVKTDIIYLAMGTQAQKFMANVDVFKNYLYHCEHPASAAYNKKDWSTRAFSFANTVITANKLGEKIKW